MAGVQPGLFALTLLEQPTRPLGTLSLPSGAVVAPDASLAPLQVFFPAVELAVSVEAAGTTPAVPTQPFVYRGLCGKLWR